MIDTDLLLECGAAFKKISCGKTIFREDQSYYLYYQLVRGKVRWVNIDDDGKEYLHSIIESGESFGELSLFDNGHHATTAIADEDIIIIRLHKPTFLNLNKENSHIHFAFTKLLVKRLRFKISIIKSFATHCFEKMIATILNYFKTENINFCGNCNQLNLTR